MNHAQIQLAKDRAVLAGQRMEIAELQSRCEPRPSPRAPAPKRRVRGIAAGIAYASAVWAMIGLVCWWAL